MLETYHNLKDDDIMKNIFNSGRHKDRVGMKIPDWMISDEMKHTEHYQMYAEVFGIDVPLTQSQPTESTQGTHRTPSAPRSPNPKVDAGEASASKRSTVIRFRIPQRRSTRLTPPASVPKSKKEILASPHPRKTTPLVQSCQRDPEAPALSLINQDLLYLKKGSSRPEKIVLSLYNSMMLISKNELPNRQKEPGKPKEVVYSNSNIIQPDYKNLNKNDIKVMYLLIMNGKVPDYAKTGIEKHKTFSIIYEHVHGIIYKNSKKEKRVMRHSEIHKFCDATLNRVLKGLKSYNNDVKYDYIQRDLTEDEVEYLELFEEEIKVRLKYHNQMRR
ncbi:hypothetical protein Tco_1162572 [Tanacetum coccineum]